MDWTISLAVTKFTSIVLTGGFAALALLTRYKDSEGNITRWGKIAIAGVAASAVTGALSQSIELLLKARADEASQNRALAELARNSELLTQINRGLNPLTNVRATFWLEVKLNHPELQPFIRRFKSQLGPLIARWESDPSGHEGGPEYPNVRTTDNKVSTVTISQDSRLFPRKTTEPFAYTVLKYSTISMYFYKPPIKIDEFPEYVLGVEPVNTEILDRIKQPDIKMSFEQNYNNPSDIELNYSPRTEQFYVHGFNIESKDRYWNSSGKIISALDLAGAQVFITSEHILVSVEEPQKRVHPELSAVALHISNRKSLWFRAQKLTVHTHRDGPKIYEYRFPDKFEQIDTDLR
jgi:hypothetical protein